MSIVAKFFKGSLLISIANVAVRLSGILVLVPLARLLGPSQLGIYSLVFWLVQSGTTLGRLGVDTTMHRNGAQLYCTNRTAAGRLLAVGGTLMGVSFTALSVAVWVWRSPLATHWLGNKDAAEWLGYAAVLLFTEGMSLVAMTGLLSLHNFEAYSRATAIGALGRLLLSPILAWRYGLLGAFLGLILASLVQLIAAVINFYRSSQQYHIPLNLHGFWQESKQILKFGLPLYTGSALIGLVTLPMMGEIGHVAGVETLGQLRIGQSLSQIVSFLPAAIAPVAISVLSEAYGTEDQNFKRLRSVHLRGNWLLTLALVMFLSLASHPLIILLFGNTYEAAIPLVIGMSWVALLTVVVDNLNLYSLTAGNTKAIAFSSIIQKFIFVGITFWLIPLYGGMGFILGLLLGNSIQLVIMIAAIWQSIESSLKQSFSILCLWTGVCVGVLFFIQLLNISITTRWSLAILLSFTIAIACGYSIFTSQEITLIKTHFSLTFNPVKTK